MDIGRLVFGVTWELERANGGWAGCSREVLVLVLHCAPPLLLTMLEKALESNNLGGRLT